MTEKEKMLAGDLYDASSPLLVRERENARRLTRLYNATKETDYDSRRRLLTELLGESGSNLVIEPPFHCDYGSHITLGSHVFINFGCVVLDVSAVRIGSYVQIGPGVHIYTARHPLDAAARKSGLELGSPVSLADNVWIGGGTIINPGISIGENTVVGSGSVVTHDLPANVLAAGNPCRIIRPLT